jgi:hypothetical protein
MFIVLLEIHRVVAHVCGMTLGDDGVEDLVVDQQLVQLVQSTYVQIIVLEVAEVAISVLKVHAELGLKDAGVHEQLSILVSDHISIVGNQEYAGSRVTLQRMQPAVANH